jgi:hypothetical protein
MRIRSQQSASHWEALQASAHLPETQDIIRREIRRGTIRVTPASGGGIRIVPTLDCAPENGKSTLPKA